MKKNTNQKTHVEVNNSSRSDQSHLGSTQGGKAGSTNRVWQQVYGMQTLICARARLFTAFYPVKRNLIAMTRNIIKHEKSCQNAAMLHGKKRSRYVRTCMIFARISRNKFLARFPRKTNHDMARYTKL